jgi:predicted RNase H-like HicB family nuclease
MKLPLTIGRGADGSWTLTCPALPEVVNVGQTKAAALKNLPGAISECLTAIERGAPRRLRHRFASEALIGTFATGIKTGDNATVRRLIRKRLGEKDR